MNNIKSRLLFAIRLLLILGSIITIFYWLAFRRAFFLNNILPITVILLLACMYASTYFHREKLIKPSIYLLPAFCVLSFSIVLITFMFGLHGETIAAYDKCEDKNDDRFKWYYLQEVLQFPMDQLRLKEEVPLEPIDFKELTDTSNICHIVLIDKTNSVNNADSLVNDFLIQSICQSFSTEYFNTKTPTGDLIAPFIISCVYNNARNNSNEALCVFLYDGIRNDFINVHNENGYTFQASGLRQSNFFEAYRRALDSCKESTKNRTGQKTSINTMISILERKLKAVGDLKRNSDKEQAPFQKYKLSIISDFINSASQERANSITSTLQIDELKTYTLPGSDKQNSTYTAAMLVNDLVGDFGNFKGNENIDFTNIKKLQEFCDNLKVSHFKLYNKVDNKTINFHYPYNSYNSNQSSIIKIGVRDLFAGTDPVSTRYFIKISDLDNPDKAKQYLIGKGKKLDNISQETGNMGELHVVNLKSQDSLFIIFPNAAVYANDRLKFEIGSEDMSKNLQTAISFLPSLSRESALFLIIFYTSFLFSVAFILILPSVFVLVLLGTKNKETKRPWIKADQPWTDIYCLCLPVFLGGILLYLPFSLYWGVWALPKLYVLGGLLFFSIPAFFYCLSKKEEITLDHFSALDIFGWQYIKRLNKKKQEEKEKKEEQQQKQEQPKPPAETHGIAKEMQADHTNGHGPKQ